MKRDNDSYAGEYIGSQSKIERYGWKVRDKPGVFADIDKRLLIVDGSYQRPENKHKVTAMAANWSWVACGAISVAKREDDSKFPVMDGGHRTVAAKRRADITTLPCMVFEVEDIIEEARGFLSANTLRRPITSLERFNAEVTAKDTDALFLAGLIDSHGIILSKVADAPLKMGAVGRAKSLVAVDRQALEETLSLCVALARKDDVPIKEIHLDGFFYLRKHGLDFHSDKKLRRRILEVGDYKLVFAARQLASAFVKGGAKVWAEGMLNAINHGLRCKYSLDVERKG